MRDFFYEDELQQYQVVIVADGELPTHHACITLLEQAKYIICCDGAIGHLETIGYKPNIIIGDGDSIPPEKRKKYETIFIENRDTDYSDLHKTIHYCIEHDYFSVAILGATGKREDHELANLSLLITYGNTINLAIFTNYGIFTPIFSEQTFNSFAGQQVSIFNFSAAKVTFQQLKFPVTKRKFVHFWEGSLNESLADTFTIMLHGGKLLIYRAYKAVDNKIKNEIEL